MSAWPPPTSSPAQAWGYGSSMPTPSSPSTATPWWRPAGSPIAAWSWPRTTTPRAGSAVPYWRLWPTHRYRRCGSLTWPCEGCPLRARRRSSSTSPASLLATSSLPPAGWSGHDAAQQRDSMKPTQQLHEAGQSLWLDNITRGLLDRGTLARYIAEDSVTGLTSNPTIFDQAIEGGSDYDSDIATRKAAGASDEEVFFELALTDLRRAADLLAPVHEYSDGVDGWVSLEVSPLLARDPRATIEQARALHAKAGRPNLFIKIPGTSEGLSAIEECTFAGLPINVTLLFSAEQYQAAAEAFLRGVERRV